MPKYRAESRGVLVTTVFDQYESKLAGDVSAGMGAGEIVAWIDDHSSQLADDILYRPSVAFVDEFRQELGRSFRRRKKKRTTAAEQIFGVNHTTNLEPSGRASDPRPYAPSRHYSSMYRRRKPSKVL